MNDLFDGLPFRPADILLPQNCDLSLWSVIACDQYTAQPEYWQRVENRVGRAPSALRLILPESCLEGPRVETDIMEINNTMSRYLREGRFQEYPNALIYVERTLEGGRVRRGLVGMVDLEAYDYEPGSRSAVRATEGTVMSRIPPRVAVRKNAPIELPHVMLLVDDPNRVIIEPLSSRTEDRAPVRTDRRDGAALRFRPDGGGRPPQGLAADLGADGADRPGHPGQKGVGGQGAGRPALCGGRRQPLAGLRQGVL